MKRIGDIIRTGLLTLCGLVLVALSSVGVYHMDQCRNRKPVIIEETKTVTRYIRQVSGNSELLKAYQSPIDITGRMRDDWIDVTASDGYKAADKSFRVGLPDPGYRNMILGGLSYRIPSGPGAWCMYYRFIIPRVGLGGGCAVDPTGASVMAGAAWMW